MTTTPLKILIHLKSNNKMVVRDVTWTETTLFTIDVGQTYPGDQRRLCLAARASGLSGNMHLIYQLINGEWNAKKIPQSGRKPVEIELKVDPGYSGPFVEGGIPVLYPLCKPDYDSQTGPSFQVASRGIRRAEFTNSGNTIHIYNDQSITQAGSFVGGQFVDAMISDFCVVTIHNVGLPDGQDPNAVGELVVELYRGINGNQNGLPLYDVEFSSSLGSKYIAAGSVALTRGQVAGPNMFKDKIVASVASMSPGVPAVQIFTPAYSSPGPNFKTRFTFKAWNVVLTSGNDNIISYNPGNLHIDASINGIELGTYCHVNLMSIFPSNFIDGY